MDTAPTCVTTPIWRTRRFRAIRGASDLRAGPDRPRPHRSRPTGRLRQVGVLLAAAAPRDGHRDLSSHESRAGARHRMRLWRALSHPVRERRHRRRRNGRPRGAPHLRAREEGGARPGGRGPRPNRPGRRGILGARARLRMGLAYTYRIPLPDRVMQITPRALSRSLAHLGTRPLPLGLQLYADFTKP